jgi:hypothetical protein
MSHIRPNCFTLDRRADANKTSTCGTKYRSTRTIAGRSRVQGH